MTIFSLDDFLSSFCNLLHDFVLSGFSFRSLDIAGVLRFSYLREYCTHQCHSLGFSHVSQEFRVLLYIIAYLLLFCFCL